MPRTALIVDDSRTALAALGRLLKAQGISVDTAESGPEALDYLRTNAAPGVVFLDHMMPGMDGFQTLAALKADADTAAIPVVMYTSREGVAYMDQALAQGALGVLHKPVNPVELAAILQRIDRLRPATLAVRPRAAVTDVPPEPRGTVRPVEPAAASAAWRRVAPRHLAWAGRLLLAGLLLLPAGWYYQRYQHSDRQRAQLSDELEQLKREHLERAAPAAAENPPLPVTGPPPVTRAWLDTLAWALNQRGSYGLHDEPLSDARLHQVRELVARLTAAGFTGTVRLETHVGEFCVTRDEQGGYRLPADGTPFNRCEVLRYPPAQAEYLGHRQSPGFARYLAQQGEGPVRVTAVSHGNSRPLAAYPDPAGLQTAGDWNQIARLNQRVEIALVPAH
jgi:CheY-like chemotaxis protein